MRVRRVRSLAAQVATRIPLRGPCGRTWSNPRRVFRHAKRQSRRSRPRKIWRRPRKGRQSRSSISSCRAGWRPRNPGTPNRTPLIEYRGPLGTVPTKISGEVFAEHMKDTAQIADKICVIRSITHGEAAHERGTHNMFTGYRPSPAFQFPSFGSVVSEEFGPRQNMPPYVCIPTIPNEYAGSGYLSSAYGPFSLGSDPASNGFAVRDLALADGINDQRFERRKSMLAAVDHHFREAEKSDSLAAMDTFYQRAYSLISAKSGPRVIQPQCRAGRNQGAVRQEQGRNANAAGPSSGRGRRTVRLDDLRRLGSPREHSATASVGRCRNSIRRSRHSFAISTAVSYSIRQW